MKLLVLKSDRFPNDHKYFCFELLNLLVLLTYVPSYFSFFDFRLQCLIACRYLMIVRSFLEFLIQYQYLPMDFVLRMYLCSCAPGFYIDNG
jgi:hypothetical protein